MQASVIRGGAGLRAGKIQADPTCASMPWEEHQQAHHPVDGNALVVDLKEHRHRSGPKSHGVPNSSPVSRI